MGLDMYLLEEFYIGGSIVFSDSEYTIKIPFKNGEKNIKLDEIDSIVLLKAQWKNFTAVHNWIIEECEGTSRDTVSVYISNIKLKELLDICREIFEDKTTAINLLPSESGPDFISEDSLDKYYMDDIEYTITILEGLDLENGKYKYEATW